MAIIIAAICERSAPQHSMESLHGEIFSTIIIIPYLQIYEHFS
jgi:hypothetical protein